MTPKKTPPEAPSQPDPDAQLQQLQETLKDLQDSGMPLAAQIAQHATATASPTATELERLQALHATWKSMAQGSVALLSKEMEKMAALVKMLPAGTPQAQAVEEILFAFGEQRRGLDLLVEFLDAGGKQRLRDAKDAIERGVKAAQRASKQAAQAR